MTQIVRKLFLLCLAIAPIVKSKVYFTHISGSTVASAEGSYGTPGTFSDSNEPPALVDMAFGPSSSSAGFLSGGRTFNNRRCSDKWIFELPVRQWSFTAGDKCEGTPVYFGTINVANSENTPGARHGHASFHDEASGSTFVFGGYNLDSKYGDMWKYDNANNAWTWVAGSQDVDFEGNYGTKGVAASTNAPPARYFAINTYDPTSKVFYIFGGNMDGWRMFQDMWEYHVETNSFVWTAGIAPVMFGYGSYGEKGVYSSEYYPGVRGQGSAVVDKKNGLVYLISGYGESALQRGNLDDIWAYNVTSKQMAWIAGTRSTDGRGTYGIKQRQSPNVLPKARYGAAVFYNPDKQMIYIYGGARYDIGSGGTAFLADFFGYNITSTYFVWLGGSTKTNEAGNYGTKGVQDPANVAPARERPAAFAYYAQNRYYFFGGRLGNAAFNDVWEILVDDVPEDEEISFTQTDDIVYDTMAVPIFGTKAPSTTTTPRPRIFPSPKPQVAPAAEVNLVLVFVIVVFSVIVLAIIVGVLVTYRKAKDPLVMVASAPTMPPMQTMMVPTGDPNNPMAMASVYAPPMNPMMMNPMMNPMMSVYGGTPMGPPQPGMPGMPGMPFGQPHPGMYGGQFGQPQPGAQPPQGGNNASA